MIPDLTDRGQLQKLLEKHNLTARKRLGQHWLFSKNVVDSLIAASRGFHGYLEIGPGVGVMTQRLTSLGPTIAIDLDGRVVEVLADSAPEATIIVEDVLQCDFRGLLERLGRPRCVVSNLPYVITSPVLELLDRHSEQFDRAVLLMQREVAMKILAEPGDRSRGALSVIMQMRFDIEKICDAPPGAFLPPPKVHSAALKFVPRLGMPIGDEFRKLVKAGFQFPRKTLQNNLLSTYGKEAIEIALHELNLDPKTRPQLLTESQWVELEAQLHTRAN